jgi:hypothetical protein
MYDQILPSYLYSTPLPNRAMFVNVQFEHQVGLMLQKFENGSWSEQIKL